MVVARAFSLLNGPSLQLVGRVDRGGGDVVGGGLDGIGILSGRIHQERPWLVAACAPMASTHPRNRERRIARTPPKKPAGITPCFTRARTRRAFLAVPYSSWLISVAPSSNGSTVGAPAT